MSNQPNRQGVKFGFKRNNQQRSQLKVKPTEFLDQEEEEPYIAFTQLNKKRQRE